MIALIMAGGAGTRFWPESRRSLPKQFLKVTGERSMLQLTVDRIQSKIPIRDIYIVTAASQVPLVQEHLPELPLENIIIEPFGMNTAPCIALSTYYLMQRYPLDETVLVLPADHVIRDTGAFLSGLDTAEIPARNGMLVTFGIVPDYPATGYGYIEAGQPDQDNVCPVTRFKEKPDPETAASFLRQGNFFWNSGMFCWTLATIREAFETHTPAMVQVMTEIRKLWQASGTNANIDELYRQMPKQPIDIAIMEPAANRVVIPVDIGWSDVGGWKALSELAYGDEQGNFFQSPGLAISARDNYIRSNKFTAVIGLDDICVIETPDSLLITTKAKAEEVKKVVDMLAAKGRDELL